MHDDLKQYTESEYYKNILLNNHPNSDYAKLIIDPNLLKESNKLEIDAAYFYNRVYNNYFKRGYYKQTIEEVNKGLQLYSGTEVDPKLQYLRAVSLGSEVGKEAMIEELKALEFKFKGKPIGKKSAETIAALQSLEKQKEEEKERIEEEKNQPKEEPSPYTFEPETNHNFIVLLPVKKLGSNQAKIALSNFNRSGFRSDDLKVSVVMLSSDTAMISVKSFDNYKGMKAYMTAFKADKIKLAQLKAAQPEYFAISFNNYAIFYQRKNLTEYLKF